jgi:hypothetical protein
MAETTDKTGQSAEPGEPAPETAEPRPPDAAAEDPKSAFQARIAAARARVNALLARAERPPLPDWPLPDETRGAGEASALEFLETVCEPSFYSRAEPERVPELLAGMTRAGLKSLAEARGAPAPDFSEEYRALGMPDPDTGKVPGAPAPSSWPEGREAAFRRLDQAAWADAREAGGLMPFASKLPPFGDPQPRLPNPAEHRAGFALPDGPALGGSPAGLADETEALLNGVIADCRLFLREIAFHSARLAAMESDRTAFIDAACRVANAAARVGDSVARTRMAKEGALVDERRQRIVVERVERTPALTEPAAAGGRGDR